MKPADLTALARLPPLDRTGAVAGATRCKVCGGAALLFDVVDFNKVCAEDYYPFGFAGIAVAYHRCRNCGLIFTGFCDEWTNEDFARHIYNEDYPLIDGDYAVTRPTRMADEMTALLAPYRSARILDYGSGSGLFAERMRGAGFAAVESYDPFSGPRPPNGEFDIITCFETIEHSPAPREMVAELHRFLQPEGCILLTTSIQPADIAELRANWWYVAPRNGHLSIYTLPALQLLAAGAGLDFYAGNGRLAFAQPSPATFLEPLLAAIGPAQATATLTAPGDAGDDDLSSGQAVGRLTDWHAVERSGAIRFRWTRSACVEWTLGRLPRSLPCELRLTIPLLMEIAPGFAERCAIQIGARSYPLRREDGGLRAIIELGESIPRSVALLTPAPQRPIDLRDTPDQRALGLAIPLAAVL